MGFWFGSEPNVNLQVDKMEKKMNARLWLLMHLKRAGVPEEDMLRLYFSLLRPVLDFAAPAYHSLLTMAHSNRLEAIQDKAMKIIYGWTVSYETVIEKTGLERLAL